MRNSGSNTEKGHSHSYATHIHHEKRPQTEIAKFKYFFSMTGCDMDDSWTLLSQDWAESHHKYGKYHGSAAEALQMMSPSQDGSCSNPATTLPWNGLFIFLMLWKKRRKKYNCSTTKVTLTSAPCGIGLKLFSGVVAVTEVSVEQNILMQDYHWLWESNNHMWSTTTFVRNRKWPHTCWNHTTTEGWQSVLDKLCTGNEEFHYNFHSENLLQCESDAWEVGGGYYLP